MGAWSRADQDREAGGHRRTNEQNQNKTNYNETEQIENVKTKRKLANNESPIPANDHSRFHRITPSILMHPTTASRSSWCSHDGVSFTMQRNRCDLGLSVAAPSSEVSAPFSRSMGTHDSMRFP